MLCDLRFPSKKVYKKWIYTIDCIYPKNVYIQKHIHTKITDNAHFFLCLWLIYNLQKIDCMYMFSYIYIYNYIQSLYIRLYIEKNTRREVGVGLGVGK